MKYLWTTIHVKDMDESLMNDKECKVHLLLDKEVVEAEYFGCHPCINTSSLKIKTSDILNKFFPYTGHEPSIVEL